ncbi:MAG: hypothetical protein Kilf2KO_34190 [Rhodospirillales bacterium]
MSAEGMLGCDRGNKPTQLDEARLMAETDEICRYHANPYIERLRVQFSSQDFTVLAIRLRKQVGKKDGLTYFLRWTTLYDLDGNSCGERRPQPDGKSLGETSPT